LIVLFFGHNAAITNFVNKFETFLLSNVPTSGFVVLEFDTEYWEEINKGKTKNSSKRFKINIVPEKNI
jgi:phosphohistidine phosphatase